MNFGISDKRMEEVTAIFAACPEVEEVLIFGSRAKGNFRPGSDIDLALKGEKLTDDHLGKIYFALDDLLMPQRFDLLLLGALRHEGLLGHIGRVGQVFYKKEVEPDLKRVAEKQTS